MGRLNRANIKKAFYYMRRNGPKEVYYAAKERLFSGEEEYQYAAPGEAVLLKQREEAQRLKTTFSIVVPAYRTPEKYLTELVESLKEQSFPLWELIIADATEDDSVWKILKQISEGQGICLRRMDDAETAKWQEGSIRYVRLLENGGIAANTNQAAAHAQGAYIGLLDHDDVLTGDALYEMAAAIEKKQKEGICLQMLYSDEDKCDGNRSRYYDVSKKEDFNLELLLSNNYICHFLVMKRELMQGLGLRSAYDGAQDYDLVLRAAECLLDNREQICHIPKVLYHWRCHEASTAQNPASKWYAYEAGRRALQDFSDHRDYGAKAVHLKHLGFYRLEYPQGLLAARQEVGAVGGSVYERGKLSGGRMLSDGTLLYQGLARGYSGYLHRAALRQEAYALDIRCISVRQECRELFFAVTGTKYQEIKEKHIFDARLLPEGTDYTALGMKLSKALREAGYKLIYDPQKMTEWE